MERTAFARAWDYLKHAPVARWSAGVGAAMSGALFVALLFVLVLFADLIVSQGKVPNYSDLSNVEQQDFRRKWAEMSLQARSDMVAMLPLPDSEKSLLAENTESSLDVLALQSLRWKASVGSLLERRAGVSAATAYRDRAFAHVDLPANSDPERVQLGVLSFVVRSRNHFLSPLVGWISSWNPWMWRPAGGGAANWPYLLGLLGVGAMLALLRFLSVVVMQHAASLATLEAITRLRRIIFHHTYRLGSLAVKPAGPSEAVSTFTRHVEAVHDGMFARLTVAIREPVKIVLLIVLALSLHFWLGLAFLCAAVVVWLVGRHIATWFRRQARTGARSAAGQLMLLQESIQMMRLAKCYLMELFNQQRVERQLHEYSKSQHRRFRGESVYRPLVVFLGTLAAGGLLFVAGWIALAGGIGVANLVIMATAMVSLYFPIDVWLAQRRLIHRAEEAAVEIFDFLDRRGEVGQVAGAEFLRAMSQKLEFDQVSLRDETIGRLFLDRVSFSISAGQKVAIVGSDIDEKRAAMYLVPRLLDPTTGEVRIDGKNLRWVTLDSLRNQIAVVSQQNLIFNDTVANNIGCGDPSFSIPQIIEAAKTVHAHRFVEKLPYGYETTVGETGHSLRVSEQFRIALARAILRDPAVLIIEEPETPLDEGAKALIDDAYERILPDRTVIFLPRRLSTLRLCERVLLLHEGRLQADGTHRSLLQDSELYRHLHFFEYNMHTEKAG